MFSCLLTSVHELTGEINGEVNTKCVDELLKLASYHEDVDLHIYRESITHTSEGWWRIYFIFYFLVPTAFFLGRLHVYLIEWSPFAA